MARGDLDEGGASKGANACPSEPCKPRQVQNLVFCAECVLPVLGVGCVRCQVCGGGGAGVVGGDGEGRCVRRGVCCDLLDSPLYHIDGGSVSKVLGLEGVIGFETSENAMSVYVSLG